MKEILGREMYDKEGKFIGKILPTGWILNEKREIIGRISFRGNSIEIYNLKGDLIGNICSDGTIFIPKWKKVGVITPSGNVYNEKWKFLGKWNIFPLLFPES